MPSVRARLLLLALQNRHLFGLRLRPETGEDWEKHLPAVRAKAAKAAKMMGRVPRDMAVSPAGDIGAEWIVPQGGAGPGLIVYFHGGGYVLGSAAAHRGVVAKFVRAGGVRALSLEYRLAPENPFPAALDDALAAWRWLLAGGTDPARVVFAGDSAGAGLALCTLVAARDAGDPLPAGAVLLSPWTDLTCSGPSYTENARRCLAPAGSWLACRDHYARGRDLRDPHISPLFADLAGLPPLRLYAGTHETMRDDTIAFTTQATHAGVDAAATLGPGLCHCYPACAPLFPEATRAMHDIGAFIRERTSA